MPQHVLDPIQRRIWRLAFLLTGNPPAAAALVDRIIRVLPDPGSHDPGRLDRLIIIRAREAISGPGPVPSDAPPQAAKAMNAALSLAPQPLEAWVLTRVDDLDELHVSRAMDCSRTATRNHLAAGEERMRARLGAAYDDAVRALRAYADSLDPVPLVIEARRQESIRRKRRWAVRLGLVAMAALLTLYVLLSIAV